MASKLVADFNSYLAEPSTTTVAEYLGQVNKVLARQRGRVQGEVIQFSPTPRAIFFSIKDKDQDAVMECLIWPDQYELSGVSVKEGDEIIVTGSANVFAKSGRFRFMANTIELAGEGALKREYERLKRQLTSEGLFAPERKRRLPTFPRRIGVITSLTSGVVIEDFRHNLNQHGFHVTMVDSRVEGKDAIHDLVAALRTMNNLAIDVLVIIRGGGSWESLQAFNTESVVREIAKSKVPVITGIGHDVDVTLAELVADVGVSTPTAVPGVLNEPWQRARQAVQLWQQQTVGVYQATIKVNQQLLQRNASDISHGYRRHLAGQHSRLNWLESNISRTYQRLVGRVQSMYELLARSSGMLSSQLRQHRQRLDELTIRLARSMQLRLDQQRHLLSQQVQLVLQRQRWVLQQSAQALSNLDQTINLNDPRRPMKLGYSLSYVNGKLVRKSSELSKGATVNTQLSDGQFTSVVKEIK